MLKSKLKGIAPLPSRACPRSSQEQAGYNPRQKAKGSPFALTVSTRLARGRAIGDARAAGLSIHPMSREAK
jgi:hypothetical protein